MNEENKLEPSRWSPPDDLVQAYNEGKTTKQLPDGSTASLSWTPEMKDRWWSYDSNLNHDNEYRYGNGISLFPGPRTEEELNSIISPRLLRASDNLLNAISWNCSCTSILISHNGRIGLNEYNAPFHFNAEITVPDERRKFYIDRLFKHLPKYLNYNSDNQQTVQYFHTNSAQLQDLEEWILTLPSWTSMIISTRLADACGISLLAGDSTDDPLVGLRKEGTNLTENMNRKYYEINHRCYELTALANTQFYNDGKSMSYEELALEYGPCWLMQSLIVLDRSTYDTQTSIDLVHDNDHWETSINRDQVLESCKLAGAMNAPIELWPRFYSMLENQSKSKLDETTILMKLATPVEYWSLLDMAESIANGHGEFVRNTCYLITAAMRKSQQIESIEQAIVENLSPTRPIKGQIIDLVITLSDVITTSDNYSYNLIQKVPILFSKPNMKGTINGATLVAKDISKMNINEN